MFGTSMILLIFSAVISNAEDLPCNAAKKEGGFICVCNSTYCDTIEPPGKLLEGEYHVYSTSNRRPGFNHYIGLFRSREFLRRGIKLVIDTAKKRQKVRGFGGSLTDATGYLINGLSQETQTNLLRSYFSSDGLEYNFARIPFHSSDFSLRRYTYIENFDPTLMSFNLTEDDYSYKIRIMQKAVKLSKRKINFLGSTWDAPVWMKTNKGIDQGYILPKYLQLWADYHVRILEAFKREGVNFWGITTGNEPYVLICFTPIPFPDIIMPPEQQRDWIADKLGPALEKSGYKNLSIVTLDDQRQFALWWMETVMRSEKAGNYITGVGIHWYLDTKYPLEILENLHNKYPGKEIMYTETSINSFIYNVERISEANGRDVTFLPQVSPLLGSWKRASYYINSIIETLNHWTTLYLDWNMALDLDGGPNLLNFTCDAPIIVNSSGDEFYKQPMFYAMGHFSKFLHPGAVLLETQTVGKPEKPASSNKNKLVNGEVSYVAGLNPDGSRTIIVFNPTSTYVQISIHDLGYGFTYRLLEPDSITTLHY